MRILLYTLALALLPMLAQANHIESDLEGYWENNNTHTTIKIKAKRHGFKIKGLYGHKKSTHFKKNRRGQYIDSRGNELIIRTRNRIVFHNRYNGLKTRFTRPEKCGTEYGYNESYNNGYSTEHYDHHGDGYYSDNHQGHQDDGYYSGGYYRGDNDNRDRRKSQTDSPRNRLSYTPTRIDDDRLRKMEGTWLSQGSNVKKVIVVSTRDGIKVKDTTNDKWHRYKLSEDRRSLMDQKGNFYQMDGQSLFWTAKNGKRVLRLEKKSSGTF